MMKKLFHLLPILALSCLLPAHLHAQGQPVAIEPALSDRIMFVSVNGSDSNDGLSWGTAKLTLSAAVSALANGGTIYVAAGNHIISSSITLGSGTVTYNLVLLAGADLQCTLNSPSSSCINLGINSSIRGWSEGLSNPVSIEAMSGANIASVITTSSSASGQGGAAHLDNLRINLDSGATINDSALNVCAQNNGSDFKNLLIGDSGATGTFSLIHVPGTCNGATASNGGGVVENVSLACGGNAGCTPLLIEAAPGMDNAGWEFFGITAENAGAGLPDVSISGYSGSTYAHTSAINFFGLHCETKSGTVGVLIDGANAITIAGYVFHATQSSGTVTALEIENTHSLSFSGVVAQNIFTSSDGASVQAVYNAITGVVLTQMSVAGYSWSNPEWNNAEPMYFDGSAPIILGKNAAVLGANGVSTGSVYIESSTSGTHTFTTPYSSPPICTATNAGATATTLNPAVTATATGVTITVSTSGSYTFRFICMPAVN